MIRTLYDKDPSDYTGPESFVRKMINEQSVDFFPINQVRNISCIWLFAMVTDICLGFLTKCVSGIRT
jgi:hypothetical protein